MKHDEIIDGLRRASGIVQNRRTMLQWKTHGRDMSPTELCLDSSYTSAIDACAAATTEIRRLGAQLAEIARSRPVARVRHRGDGGIDGPLLDHQVEPVRRMSWTPLIAAEWADRSAPQPPAAEPVLEIRACGCGAAKNGRCVMGDYGVLPIGTRLYADMQPPTSESTLKPLRNELLDEMLNDALDDYLAHRNDGYERAFARAIERAHGIGTESDKKGGSA